MGDFLTSRPSKKRIFIILSAVWLFVLSYFFLNLRGGHLKYSVKVVGASSYYNNYPVSFKLSAFDDLRSKFLRIWLKECKVTSGGYFVHSNCAGVHNNPLIVLVASAPGVTGPLDVELKLSVEGDIRTLKFAVNLNKCGVACSLEEQLKTLDLPATKYHYAGNGVTVDVYPHHGFFSEGFPQHAWFRAVDDDGAPVKGNVIIDGQVFPISPAGLAHVQVKLKPMKTRFEFSVHPSDQSKAGFSSEVNYGVNSLGYDVPPIGVLTVAEVRKGAVIKLRRKKYIKELFCDLYLGDKPVLFTMIKDSSLELPQGLRQGLYRLECSEHYLIKNKFNPAQHFIVTGASTQLTLLDGVDGVTPEQATPDYYKYVLTRMHLPNKGSLKVLVSTRASDTEQLKKSIDSKRLLITIFLIATFFGILFWAVVIIVKEYTRMKKAYQEYALEGDDDEYVEIGRRKFFVSVAGVLAIIILDITAFIWLLNFMSLL